MTHRDARFVGAPRERTRVLDVQFDIHRKLADVASGAKIVGAGDAYGTDHRQQQFA
jgi:hypothetical protein